MLSPKSETKMPISVASVPSVAKTEFEKTNPICILPQRTQGTQRKKEIQTESYFSAVLALSAVNLKKQSQFVEGQLNIFSYIERHYRNVAPFQGPENKANQSQFYGGYWCSFVLIRG